VPHSFSEVTEYVKYTPTADDFDLEKQFGVKPLPYGGAAAGRSKSWLYAVAGVLAAVTVGLVAAARRRRSAAHRNSP